MRDLKASFFSLSTSNVIDAVEAAVSEQKNGCRATGRVLALNSLENRVYEIEFEDRSHVVAKFYRPQRWNEAQLQEEHLFLKKLLENEVPVVAPVALTSSKFSELSSVKSLAKNPDGIYFAVFPKVKGRLSDELNDQQLQTLGRYLGRIHNIGEIFRAKYRLRLNVNDWAKKPLEYLMKTDFIDEHTKPHYESLVKEFIRRAEGRVERFPAITLHGDCHLGNTLWQEESPFFLDFDDMMIAPPVQDVWMIIRGRDEDAQKQRETLLSGYEQMREFDRSSFSIIEVLRGLRIIHYSAWIARRWDDPGFPIAFPHFRSPTYWRAELEALREILELMG